MAIEPGLRQRRVMTCRDTPRQPGAQNPSPRRSPAALWTDLCRRRGGDRWLPPLALALGLATSPSTAAQPADLPARVPLWTGAAPVGDGPPVGGNAWVTVHRPARANGTAVVICPGGGYGGLVTGPEGHGIARWLNRHGVIGVVLEYRLPSGNPAVPLLDAQQAIRWTRARMTDWGGDPRRIGILGFSAGGHLASTAATHFDEGNVQAREEVERKSSRPDFAALIYPVITMGEATHGGSRRNLLGPDPSPSTVRTFSTETQVTPRTPPTFLAHARDDRVVPAEHSRMFYRALREHGVPARYLELPSGDHGLNGYRGPMWDAWQDGLLGWLAEREMIPATDVEAVDAADSRVLYPAYEVLARQGHQPRLLPGVGQFVFTLYGVPGDATVVHQLVDVLRDRKLGNGFDPGPGPSPSTRPILDFLGANGWPVVFYSGGEMQIQGGRAVFGREAEAALAGMDRVGVFNAFQLGEWGYYFHNLSHRESWWREVYGSEYPAFQHLRKPEGLAGYDRRPGGKREGYEVLRSYYVSRSRDLLGRVISVTGHSHYESYAAAWGARCVGLELGENIAFTQSKLAFARGAARQWDKPWSVQVSPWFGPTCTTRGELRTEGGIVRGLDAGHSLSFYERLWLHSWFSGAAMVTPENSLAIFFEEPKAPWTLTEHGRKAAEVFQFMTSHDRGIPYTPVAVVLDRYAGYNGFMDKPWGILDPTPGDREARDLFDHQLFPGSDHIHAPPDPANPEASYLRPTPYGEIFDVLLSSAPPEVLSAYSAILLVGDHEFEPGFLSELEKSLRRGRRVLMTARHRSALGSEYDRLARQGTVEVVETWTHPATGRPAAIPHARLEALGREYLPVVVEGDAVQYAINRTRDGWVVELINNRGVIKRGDRPAVVDPAGGIRVTLKPKVKIQEARAWRSGRIHTPPDRVDLELDPGAVEFIELVEAR